MVDRLARRILFELAALVLVFASMPAWAQEPSPSQIAWVAPKDWFVYGVLLIVLFGSLLALLFIRAALGGSEWSLADALSEEAEVTAMIMNTTTNQREPKLDSAEKPMAVIEMRASSSRLIALMGMMAILLIFLGFGIFALYSFAHTGSMPTDIDKVIYFLIAGMTLFTPYVVNKFSAIFESLSPKGR